MRKAYELALAALGMLGSDGVLELLDSACAAGAGGDFLDLMVQLGEFFVGQVLQAHVVLAGTLGRTQEFVELELDCLAIAVLGVLDEKYHQEGDDSRPGVDDKLPGVAKLEHRTRSCPYQYDEDSAEKHGCRPRPCRYAVGNSTEDRFHKQYCSISITTLDR